MNCQAKKPYANSFLKKYLMVTTLSLPLSFTASCGFFDQIKKNDSKSKSTHNEHSQDELSKNEKTDETIISELGAKPREDILLDDDINDFLKNHNVYISLTTSPKRISKVHHVLATLDLDLVTNVIIALPEAYGRDGATYDIPESLTKHKKVLIERIPKDLGPITKLLPAVEYVKKNGNMDRDIIITVDDDTAYPWGMVGQFIKHMALNKEAVVYGASANDISFWDLSYDLWPSKNKYVTEGFGGVGYKAKFIDSDLMIKIADEELKSTGKKNCYNSDDIVISYALALKGVSREVTSSEYYNLDQITQFSYGFEEDALHRGAGNSAKISAENINHKKYQACFNFMVKNFPKP